jgi:DNA-binding transcriptional LysR family regulator
MHLQTAVDKLDSLTALNVFVRAAEACNFTDAARQLGLSASAVGKAVARLEDRLTVRLFHRSTRCVTLTQEGMLFLERCQRIIAEMKAVECEFAETKREPRGKLRVGLPLAGLHILPVVANFMRAYRDIELDLDFSDRSADLIESGFDVVLRNEDMSDSRLMSRCLGTYRIAVVGSPAYFDRAGTPFAPASLSSHACLHRKDPASGKLQRWPFTRSATTCDMAIPTTAVASTFEPLIALAEAGVGIACVPDFMVRQQLDQKTLVSVLGDYVESTEALRAVWPSSRYLSPRLRAFIDFMAAHLVPLLPATDTTTDARTDTSKARVPIAMPRRSALSTLPVLAAVQASQHPQSAPVRQHAGGPCPG